MPSTIDPSVIGVGNVDKASVRLQLERARDEITALQTFSSDDRVINGTFDLWQYSTSSTTAQYSAADCWRNDYSGGTTTLSRQALALGTGFGSNYPAYNARQSVTLQTLVSHYAMLSTRIEDVRSYANQTITVLGWARRASGTGNMSLEVAQYFGTGGAPSSGVTGIGATPLTLTTSWVPFAVPVSVPSVSGKTIGTTTTGTLDINFWTSAGSNYNARSSSLSLQTIEVELWGVHIKRGTWTTSEALNYVARPYAEQLQRAQRYCNICQMDIQSPAAGFMISPMSFPCEMYVTPNITVIDAGVQTLITSVTEAANRRGFYTQIQASSAGGSITGRILQFTTNPV